MMSNQPELIEKFVNSRLITREASCESQLSRETGSRVVAAMKLMPDDELGLFLEDRRKVSIEIVANPKLPFGMKTRSAGSAQTRLYTIFICEECREWDENRFIGALLREFGHIVAEIPPEEEWPISRGDKARFKEYTELVADCMVWKWGLRHYDMSFLVSTFPPHWVDRIVTDIEKLIETDERFR